MTVEVDTVALNISYEGLIDNDQKVASSKKHTQFKTTVEYKTHTLFKTKVAKIETLFMTKTAKNKHTLWGRTYLYSAYKGVPPPPSGSQKK